ncbi:leucine-rich repeat-containing protein 24 [Macrosteles quadrilineatus]|uniref:leucine-rich repeat-containing protein 24 n=1 Tax=Macrosteles quadrilineatus TaxID=74068 RepID=UPI0023E15E0B|nr:leucine-rich repeat-containing protein 24 [Macrosteles quadrilineatus]
MPYRVFSPMLHRRSSRHVLSLRHFTMCRVILLSLLVAVLSTSASSELCPNVCVCKWKGGKQTVECLDRSLITIPDNIEPATQVLDVSGNNLQILPRDTFVRINLLNLQRLYIRSCKLGQIDPEALRGLKNLVELDLSDNLLTSIPSSTFNDVPFLRDLTLAHNPIQKVEGFAFQTVPNLIKLDLSQCQLQFIAPKAFEGVEQLENLRLNGNKLRELRPKTVERLSRLHGVEMHDNPWVCDCNLREAKMWLIEKNIPYPISPTCIGGPDRVLGRSFNELDIEDFACKPEIRLDSRYVEATKGDNATIVCKVESVPAAHVNWYWNGRHLVNNSAFSSFQRVVIVESGDFEKKSTLIITNAQEADSGEFNCLAENRAGNVEANYTLHVRPRIAGMATLNNGQIVGVSAALVILILVFLLVILVLLMRFRRTAVVDTKTPNQMESVPNGNAGCSAKPTSPMTMDNAGFGEKKTAPSELNLNPIQKPPRSEMSFTSSYGGSIVNPQFINPASNPDLINDTKRPDYELDEASLQQRPASGEYARAGESLYPSGLWDQAAPGELQRSTSTNFGYDSNDKTPIIDGMSVEEDYSRALEGYPPDYGLPILPTSSPGVSPTNPPHPSAKTLRVWQRGVPVLPPVTALKRVLSRNSPDEGYQEGCGTDV